LAKYTSLKETAAYIKKLGLKNEELTSPEMEQILTRAKERVGNAILFVSVGDKRKHPSFFTSELG